MKTNKKTIKLTESMLRKMIKEAIDESLSELSGSRKRKKNLNEHQIMDNLCLQVEKCRYGEFSIRDVGSSWLEFECDAWISDGNIEIDFTGGSDDARVEQLCDSEEFQQMCKSAILSDCPENIKGFRRYVDEIGDWNEAIENLQSNLSHEADTLEKRDARVRKNMADSGDFYNAKYGY